MDTIIKFSKADFIQPNQLLFKEFSKVLSKGFLVAKPEIIKACSKIISGLSESQEAIEVLMEYGDGKIINLLLKNFQELKDRNNLSAIEDVLEMLHILVENSPPAQEICSTSIMNTLLLFITNSDTWTFSVQLEASKLLNLILENGNIPEHLLQSQEYALFLGSFGECVQGAGDYELQATIMEAVFRVLPMDKKHSLAASWFPQTQIQNLFLAIRNEEFETDGRRFLNALNSMDQEKQMVFSFPAVVVSLGRYQLQRPRDGKVTDFWVDFNVRSSSISTFVNDDSANEDNLEWEIVCIKKDEIRDFRVNVNEEKTILILKLTEPAYLLAPFCPEANECYVKIVFSRNYHSHLTKALENLFGRVKYVELPISSPSVSLSSRASAAISPLAVHNVSTQRNSSDEEKRISDKTVSFSSSFLQLEEKEKKHIKQQPGQNQLLKVCPKEIQAIEDDKNIADEKPSVEANQCVVPESQEKFQKTNSQRKKTKSINEDSLIVGTEKNANGVQFNGVNSRRPEENVDFEIENKKDGKSEQEAEEVPKMTLKSRKKGKKLMSAQHVFQDSPDDMYQEEVPPEPVKPVTRKQQHKKTVTDTVKPKAKLKKIEDLHSLAAYDFDEEKALEKDAFKANTAEEKKATTATKKGSRGRPKKQQIVKKEKHNSQEIVDNSNSARYLRRNVRKIDYNETSKSDIEDKVVGKKSKSNGRKKSVSFISPLTETHSYTEENSRSPANHKENEKEQKIKDIIDIPLTPEGGDPDVLAFVEKLENIEKQKRVKDSSPEVQPITPNNSNFKADLTSTPNEEKETNSIKTFERNIQLGWGKKKDGYVKADFDVYEFVEDEREEQEAVRKISPPNSKKRVKSPSISMPKETPWSEQKRKRNKVKKKYEMKKILPLKCKEFEFDSEKENDATLEKASKKIRGATKQNADKCSEDNTSASGDKHRASKTTRNANASGNVEEQSRRYTPVAVKKTGKRSQTKKNPKMEEQNQNHVEKEKPRHRNKKVQKGDIVLNQFEEEGSPVLSTNATKISTKRFYRKSSNSPSSSENDEHVMRSNIENFVPRKAKRTRVEAHQSFQYDDHIYMMGDSDSDHISSVDASLGGRFFNETPIETPSHPRNHWVHELNEKLDNIEAVCGLKKQGKRRLWKSPVVIMKDDEISSPEGKPKQQHKPTKSPNVSIQPNVIGARNQTTKELIKKTDVNRSVLNTPVCEVTDDVNNFAKFCQSMLEQAGKSSRPDSKTMANKQEKNSVQISPDRTFSPSNSPYAKRKKVEIQPESVEPTPNLTVVDPIRSPEQHEISDTSLNEILKSGAFEQVKDVKDISCTQSTMTSSDEGPDNEEDEMVSCNKYTNNSLNDGSNTDGNDIQALLQTFGSNVYKSINNKNQCIEKFVNNVMKTTKKKMSGLWQTQVKARISADATFQKQYDKDFEEWTNYFKQRERSRDKIFEKLRETMKVQGEEEFKKLSDLKQSHMKFFEERKKHILKERNEQGDMQTQLHNDIKKLKKQMLHQAKAAEFANVRRSLQAMLNKV